MNKLPPEFQLAVTRDITDQEWDIDLMLKIVEHELDARERAALCSGTQTKRQNKGLPTAATLLSKDSSPNCIYCDHCQSARLSQMLKNESRCY